MVMILKMGRSQTTRKMFGLYENCLHFSKRIDLEIHRHKTLLQILYGYSTCLAISKVLEYSSKLLSLSKKLKLILYVYDFRNKYSNCEHNCRVFTKFVD